MGKEEKPVVVDLVPLGTAQLERAQKNNTVFSGGIKDGGDFLPLLSLKGRQFHIKTGKNEVVSLENRTLDVIMVTAREGISKQYFEGEFQPGTSKAPDCKSMDGLVPDADIANPPSRSCATCRMNAWGSKINKLTGKEGKACGDFKSLILAPPTLDSEKPLHLSLPAASLKNLGLYIKLLNHNGLAANEVVTQLKFTDGDSFPKLEFKYVRNLTADEVAQTLVIAVREDVLATVKTPERSTEAATSEQPVVAPTAPAANPTPAATVTAQPSGGETPADNPSDEVSNILGRWGATAKK